MSRHWLLALALLVAAPAMARPRTMPADPPDASDVAQAQRRRSIDMLEELLRETEGEKQGAMLHRLAELYAEAARVENIAARDAWIAACDADPDHCPADPDLAAYHRDHDRSIALYRQLLRAWPHYERIDEARFSLALAFLEREEVDAAGDQLRQYVRLHPDGAHAHLAWLQLGELELEAGRAFQAANAFRKSAGFKDGEYRATAEHRLGWALKNLGEDADALQALRRAVMLAQQAGDIALLDEGRRDLVRFAVEAGTLQEVEDLLGTGESRVKALTLAAQRHAEQGEVDAAITVWKRVITEAPTHPERPVALEAVTRELRSAGRYPEAIAAARRLVDEHSLGSSWGRANASQPDRILEARAAADRELRRIATAAHTEARKLRARPGGAEAASAAGQAYQAWIDAFSQDDPPRSAEVHRAYGELLYERQAWDKAFAEYEAVWTIAPGTPGAKQAAVDALHAADRLLEAHPPPAPPTGEALHTAPPRPLTEHEQRLLRAADAALREGTDKEAAVVYRSAYVLYRAMHFEDAATRFRRVIALEPRSEDAERAAHLIADMLAVRESWDALAENARFYAEQDGLGSPAFRQKMAALARKAELKQVEARLAADGDRARAAHDTLAWVDRHDEDGEPEVISVALRDAAAHYEASGDPLAAARARERFLAHPALQDDPKRQAQWLALGDDHERLARWADAAASYGNAVALGGDDPRLVEAAWRQGLLVEALGDPSAIDALDAFIARSDDAARTADARLRQARLAATPDRWQTLLDDAQLPLPIRLEAALALHGSARPGALQEGLALLPDAIPDDLADLAGALRFRSTDADFEAFTRSRLTARPEASPTTQTRHIARQLAALQTDSRALNEALTQVVATRSGRWGLAAAVRLGAVQEAWATLLDESPRPTHLTESQLAVYEQELADRIWMRRNAARQHYAAAIERAYALNLYTEDTARARARLAEIDPDDWPVQHEVIDADWQVTTHREPATYEASFD